MCYTIYAKEKRGKNEQKLNLSFSYSTVSRKNGLVFLFLTNYNIRKLKIKCLNQTFFNFSVIFF